MNFYWMLLKDPCPQISRILDQAAARARERVVALVPIDTGRGVSKRELPRWCCFDDSQCLTSRNSRMSSPRAAQHDIMLAVVEVIYFLSVSDHISLIGVNSPLYAGYSFIGLKPSGLSKTELVHSHRPPMSLSPASLLPFCVTGIGCQCLKPTFASERSVNSVYGSGLGVAPGEPLTEPQDGGVSCTPSLTRWLKA